MAFDGGAAKEGDATAGFIIADSSGKELVRCGLLLGPGLTNNEAESTACLEALKKLQELYAAGLPNLRAPIRVLGDSQLVIRMLLGVYKKVRKPSLYIAIEGIRSIVRQQYWKVAYRAIPRQMNAQADDMCRRALAAGGKVEYAQGDIPADAPHLDVTALYAAVEEIRRASSRAFALCSVVDPSFHTGTDLAPGDDTDALGEGPLPDTLPSTVLAAWDDRLRGQPC